MSNINLVNKRPQRQHVNREETLVQIRLAREVALENTTLLTAESRKQLISLLSYDERKMFLNFIKSIDEKLLYSGK